MAKQPAWVLRVLEAEHYKCSECGSDQLVVISEKKTALCKLCYADKHQQVLKYSNPTPEMIMEIRNQGKTWDFVAKFLGFSRQQVNNLVKTK